MLVEMNAFNSPEERYFSPEPMDASGTGSGEEMNEDEPALDEEDLEENDLSEEEADNIEWEQPEEPDQDLSKNESENTTI
jgi:hypothetical protein